MSYLWQASVGFIRINLTLNKIINESIRNAQVFLIDNLPETNSFLALPKKKFG